MSIENIRNINYDWGKLLLEYEYNDSFWNYEPFSDNYWNEQYKIVFCNTEPYGDVKKNNHLYTIDNFKEHLNKGIRTIKNTSLFVYCLYKGLYGETFEKNKLKELYKQDDELLSVIKSITYMNLRKEESWNETPDQQNEEIYRFLIPGMAAFKNEDQFDEIDRDCSNKSNRDFTLKFIEELEPDIFIISSKVGQDVLNKIYEGKINLGWQKTFKYNGILFASVDHPSRISYQYIIDRTKQIINDYIEKK
jgi:hypothetical protein